MLWQVGGSVCALPCHLKAFISMLTETCLQLHVDLSYITSSNSIRSNPDSQSAPRLNMLSSSFGTTLCIANSAMSLHTSVLASSLAACSCGPCWKASNCCVCDSKTSFRTTLYTYSHVTYPSPLICAMMVCRFTWHVAKRRCKACVSL